MIQNLNVQTTETRGAVKRVTVGWFHKQMRMVWSALQDVHERDLESIHEIHQFLDYMEYYCGHTELTEELGVLVRFFDKYPAVDSKEVYEAFQSIKKIYKCLGIHLSIEVIIPNLRNRKAGE